MKLVIIFFTLLVSSIHTPSQGLVDDPLPAAHARAEYAPAQATPQPTADATPAPTAGANTPGRRSMAGPIIGVALVFMASTVALGFALGLRKRINAIAGPPPDDEED